MTAEPTIIKRAWLTGLSAIVFVAAAVPALAGIKIANKGRTEARIVVAPAASETERFAAQELVKNLKDRLRANPSATIASVSQNDCFGNCACPLCRAVDEEEGGPAARPMESYLEGLEKAVGKSGDALGCYSPAAAKFLSLDTLARSWRILETAKKNARRSAEYSRRVRRASLPVAYVVIARWDSLREEARKAGKRWPWLETRTALLDWFLKAAHEENITMISEWQTLADWAVKNGRPK